MSSSQVNNPWGNPNRQDIPEHPTPAQNPHDLVVWTDNSRAQSTRRVFGPQNERRVSITDAPARLLYRQADGSLISLAERQNIQEALLGGPSEQERQQLRDRFLSSEPNWAQRLHTSGGPWTAVKCLGQGTAGIAGLWQGTGSDPAFPKFIVVKQETVPAGETPSIPHEENHLRQFRRLGIEHLLRILNPDPIPREQNNRGESIYRIYLEYCDQGTFVNLIERTISDDSPYTAANPLPEDLVWYIFLCLAKALQALDTGSESVDAEPMENELIHMSPNLTVVVFGKSGSTSKEHRYTPTYKVADFGLMQDLWGRNRDERRIEMGTEQYTPPEASDNSHLLDDDMITSAVNVWQVGKCMYELICRAASFECAKWDRESFWTFVDYSNLRTFATTGKYMANAPYSKNLRLVVLRCLAVEPEKRITPNQLLRQVQSYLSYVEQAFPDTVPLAGYGTQAAQPSAQTQNTTAAAAVFQPAPGQPSVQTQNTSAAAAGFQPGPGQPSVQTQNTSAPAAGFQPAPGQPGPSREGQS
ncbi:hypothetical protein BP6252_12874 [Coleophoma cylindrospora]|uniref:non-specific serine/threonine protein kinase n=1 Tax=Coleophoma cylindrospora TaxID=1849047 RepID=A0A3D8QDI4_9HELO|nr:hypothetical protein BP6252_12874 [Coleophoma cylindrospora]